MALHAPDVADLGAGTGISSIALADAGRTSSLSSRTPTCALRFRSRADIVVVDGTAEVTTLPDRSVDIVTAFQAYHWFDPDASLREAAAHRPTRARAIAAVWNDRDEKIRSYANTARSFGRT